MHINILLQQVVSSLEDLKSHIAKFEKHQSPSTHYAQQLYTSIQETNKLLSAYVVLKEQNDVSPDLDLHLKLMSVPNTQETAIIKETIQEQTHHNADTVVEFVEHIEPEVTVIPTEVLKIEEPIVLASVPKIEVPETIIAATTQKQISPVAPLVININDKFRFINELFLGNATEYAVAIEQLNALDDLQTSLHFMKEIKAIYNWNEESEMYKKLNVLVSKRFV